MPRKTSTPHAWRGAAASDLHAPTLAMLFKAMRRGHDRLVEELAEELAPAFAGDYRGDDAIEPGERAEALCGKSLPSKEDVGAILAVSPYARGIEAEAYDDPRTAAGICLALAVAKRLGARWFLVRWRETSPRRARDRRGPHAA